MFEVLSILVMFIAGVSTEIAKDRGETGPIDNIELATPLATEEDAPKALELFPETQPQALELFPMEPTVVVTPAFAAFYSGLQDCVNFTLKKDLSVFANTPANTERFVTQDGGSLSAFYPKMIPDADFYISAEFDPGNSLTQPSYQCTGTGDKSPIWPVFSLAEYPAAQQILSNLGMVEINFPSGPKMFANCGAPDPDTYVLFNAGDGDRVVFATQVGEETKTFCSVYGILD